MRKAFNPSTWSSVHLCIAALDVEHGCLASALHGARFDNKVRTLWILEGLTYYLSATANEVLFQTMAALSAPGSMFGASMAPQTLVEKASQRSRGGLMKLWTWGFPTNFGEVLLSIRRACVLAGAVFLPLATRRFAPVVWALPLPIRSTPVWESGLRPPSTAAGSEPLSLNCQS